MRSGSLLAGIALLVALPLQAQQAAPQCDSLAELTREIRQLREAVERASDNMTQGQIMMERLRLQQARLVSAESSVELNQRRLSDVANSRQELAGMIKMHQSELESIADPEHRKAIENQLRMLQSRAQALAREEQSLREQEAKLALNLQTEQENLQSIMRELSDLIRGRR